MSAAAVEVTFATSKAVDDLDRLFYLRQGLIKPFVAAAADMNQRGWILKVEDGYRTPLMQKRLARKPQVFDAILKMVIWECGGEVPDIDFIVRRVGGISAANAKVGTHVAGCAIDISVCDRKTGAELDRGGPYIEISALMPMASPFASDQAKRNRQQITAIMIEHGFVAYPYEFWHYNQGDAYDQMIHRTGQPARYGPIDFDPKTNSLTPVENPTTPLNSHAEMQSEVRQALQRIGHA
jgi:D-alanyl-D-alanine dipeptidase